MSYFFCHIINAKSTNISSLAKDKLNLFEVLKKLNMNYKDNTGITIDVMPILSFFIA